MVTGTSEKQTTSKEQTNDLSLSLSLSLSLFLLQFNLGVFVNITNGTEREVKCTDHLISTFVLLELLVWVTYWFGVFLFSRQETEYLITLAEKVAINIKLSHSIKTSGIHVDPLLLFFTYRCSCS